ncbi:hypothetical protein BCR35DRAFT_2112 [Leucosporidium creatinivorum]|uniref:Zn(2)-C6 fungal-type domain-containing protein n=1 Tax=Leucosporidium creatinivorum TaxID=106004 RepID=A0A1Y2G7D9_9BASI|nr:hypothetical protein BCR35DRAFT_2112 [Leucosporidium creatinivorum]
MRGRERGQHVLRRMSELEPLEGGFSLLASRHLLALLARLPATRLQAPSAVAMSEDGDFKPFKSSAGKAKKRAASSTRKPGRGAVACTSCRSKKISCDLQFPACGTCTARGEELSCSFQSLLSFDDPSEIPSVQLRAKLDLLESKILKLRSTSQSSESARPASTPKQPLRAVSAPSSLAGAGSPRPLPPVRFVNQDAEVASRLLAGSLNIGQHRSDTIDFPTLVSQTPDYQQNR